jgi:hypothetical protein
MVIVIIAPPLAGLFVEELAALDEDPGAKRSGLPIRVRDVLIKVVERVELPVRPEPAGHDQLDQPPADGICVGPSSY